MQTRPIETFKDDMLIFHEKHGLMLNVHGIGANGILVADVYNGGWRMFYDTKEKRMGFSLAHIDRLLEGDFVEVTQIGREEARSWYCEAIYAPREAAPYDPADDPAGDDEDEIAF